MSEYQAVLGIMQMSKQICHASPKTVEVVNRIGPSVAEVAVTSMTGNVVAGKATHATVTGLADASPNSTAEFLVGVAAIPVLVVASPFIVAAAILGSIFGSNE